MFHSTRNLDTLVQRAVGAESSDESLHNANPRTRSELRVLIVEDNFDAADTLREVLELSNHRVEIALDGFEGLRRVRTFAPHVVLCDIGLPHMNGYEFARTLRGQEQLNPLHLIAMTGYAHRTDRSLAFAAGFDRHMVKPFRPDELVQVLDEVRSGYGFGANR